MAPFKNLMIGARLRVPQGKDASNFLEGNGGLNRSMQHHLI